ncbi:hypothetical protein N7462_007754 [Penicillium macrosclerotiorum]|uniref:uncharacterized protein n=1 Tax=Penicillium macrosclerotiorum TaxID=303699 RepID=UPI0025467F67|nr:uncharacterized protein N7462_007754 [Penicillium macrosclerotiorum]KAJ5679510.1 hypothetical protein N7462_007754 [Penicillium macrosclerotiorum]
MSADDAWGAITGIDDHHWTEMGAIKCSMQMQMQRLRLDGTELLTIHSVVSGASGRSTRDPLLVPLLVPFDESRTDL